MPSIKATDRKYPSILGVEIRDLSVYLILGELLWLVISTVVILAYVELDPKRAAVGILGLYAASALGTLMGFLFGIPKANADLQSSDGERRRRFLPNTNLEQVSDWLTKIIVGVSLIQFREIASTVSGVGDAFGSAIQSADEAPNSGKVFAISLLVAGASLAFIITYMWTSTRLQAEYNTIKLDDSQ